MNADQEFRNVINILKQLQQVKAPADFDADLMKRISSENLQVRKNLWGTIFIPSRMVPAAALIITSVILIFVINNSGVSGEDPFSVIPRVRQDIISKLVTDKISPVAQNKVKKLSVEGKSDKEITHKDEAGKNNSPKSIALDNKSLLESARIQKGGALRDDKLEIIKPEEKFAATKTEKDSQALNLEKQISLPSVSGNIAANEPVSSKYLSLKDSIPVIPNYQINKAALNFRQIRISNEQRKELNFLKQKMQSMFGK